MMRHALIGTTLGVAWMLAPLAHAMAADDAPSLTQAQVVLFESNHLKDITRPVRLEYAFTHQGGAGDFTDKVTEDIRDVHPDGRKDVWVQFLSGTHQMKFPPAIGFNGNPLLMYFLEHDATEMQQATGGASGYFRNRIRNAFLNAEMHSIAITVDGKTCAGREIVIAPFRDDPHFAQSAFREKSYRFTLCDGVPGTIYRIATTVPAVSNGAGGVYEEAMTYEGEQAL